MGDQQAPAVTALSGGGFVVTWESFAQDGSGYGLYGQRFAADGAPAGTEFQVNTYTSGDQADPAVAALAGGGFVLTWTTNGQDGSGYGVFGQRFAADGTPAGAEFRANTYTNSEQESPAVAALAGGGFVVTWESWYQDGSGAGVYAQRYAADGAKAGTEFRASVGAAGDQTDPQ